MINQYITTDNRVVTEWPDKKVWFVSDGKFERKFLSLTSFLRYMTK